MDHATRASREHTARFYPDGEIARELGAVRLHGHDEKIPEEALSCQGRLRAVYVRYGSGGKAKLRNVGLVCDVCGAVGVDRAQLDG